MAPPERAGVTVICSAMTRPPDTTKILPHELTLLLYQAAVPLQNLRPIFRFGWPWVCRRLRLRWTRWWRAQSYLINAHPIFSHPYLEDMKRVAW